MSRFSWLTARRLQTQLLAWTALILIVCVVVASEIRTRANMQLLESYLQERSETLVRAVDKALGLSKSTASSLDVASLEETLRQFTEADRTLIRLDVVEIRDGKPGVLATTSMTRQPVVDSILPEVSTTRRSFEGETVMVTTEPVPGTNLAMVAVSSRRNIDQYQDVNRWMTPAYSFFLIVIVIALMYLMYSRTVSNRFDELLDGIRRAKDGEAAAIPDDRHDEIGIIAKTLNSLLAQVRSFNDELQRQVARATEDLNKRNLALEQTTRQMVNMQHQLLESERLATVGQMAATFAHEIGSPMSSLSVHAQLLLEDPRLSADQRETLSIIREQIQAVVQIVNELLRSARRGPSDFVLTDTNEILRTVIRLVQPKLTSHKIEVSADLHTVPLMRGYPLYLQEVFLNIINNASEAMPNGGRLELKSWFDDETELLNVRILDTGPGIDPSVVEKVFDHFVTTKAIGEGSGLGLGIVKEIVDSHRGTVKITPREQGGTSAHLTFPVEVSAVRAS